MPTKDLAGKNLARANLRDVDLTSTEVNPEASRQTAWINGRSARSGSSLAGSPVRSNVESVVAIKVDDEPCCVEILVAGIDRSTGDLPGILAIAEDEGLVVLTLNEAQALHAKLEAAIRVLAASGGSSRA